MTTFDPVFPIPVIALVLGAAGLLACYREFRSGARSLRPGWLRFPALLCRLGALAVLAFLLLNPSLSVEQSVPSSKPLILIDGSDSMLLRNAKAVTRWEEGVRFLSETTSGLEEAEVRVFSNQVSEATTPEDAKAEGGLTLFGPTLEKVLSSREEVYDPVIVVSDGRPTDRGDLGNALALARTRGVTLAAHVVGDETQPRNAAIASVLAPEMIRAKAGIGIKVSLDFTGFSDEEEVTLEVRDSRNSVVATREVPANFRAPVAMNFESELSGEKYVLELKTSGAEEISLADNRYPFEVKVAARKIRVLMVEGTHVKRSVGTRGHWWNDLRLLTDAWESSGEIDYELLTATSEYANVPNLYGVSLHNGEMKLDITRTFPKTREELYKFDVMMISDIPVGNFSEEQMQWVVDWVIERGAGFLMAGGYRTFDVGNYDKTPWEKIIPVDMLEYGEGFSESFFTFKIPKAVKGHPLWTLDPDEEMNQKIIAAHPNFTGMNRVRRAKPGALVLAERSDAPGEPVIAAQKYGRGRSVAFMPDLNGGWAKYYIGWGPEGGPVQGRHTELGHGERFIFKEAAAQIPPGEAPPHPAPYYGRYWVNMVNWLGANSVRWRDDQLAGRISFAQATPGKVLPVSAEVLAAIDPKKVPDLDVAARLDLPGSPRVRLEYDRDRREYLGEVFVPMELSQEQVSVIFEANFDGKTALDQVKVSVQKRNPEYLESSPDEEFLSELVSATGGNLLTSPESAINFVQEVIEKRAAKRMEKNLVPRWAQWPVWALLAILLGAEWLLRRKGHGAVGALAVIIFGTLQFPSHGEENLPALIAQLGADRVRLRDDAETKLREMPEAYEALRKIVKESKNEELRLRAGHVLEVLKNLKWQLVAELPSANTPGDVVMGMAVAPDQKRAFTRCKQKVVIWDLEKMEAIREIANRSGMWGAWRDDGPVRFLDVSPDGKTLAATGSMGWVHLYDLGTATNEVKRLSRPRSADEGTGLITASNLDFRGALWSAEFFDEGKKLLTGDGGGNLEIWDLEENARVELIPAGMPWIVFSIAVSPDQKHLVVCLDEGSPLDHLWMWSFEKSEWISKLKGPRMSRLVFSRDGKKLIASGRDGGLYQFQVGKEGLEAGRIDFGLGAVAGDVLFSSDEKSAFVGTGNLEGEIAQVDLESGEILWRSSPMNSTVHRLAWLSKDRLVALHASGKLSIWEPRN